MVSVEQVRSAPSWRRVEIALIAGARKVAAAFDHRLAQIDLNLNQASLLAFINDFGERSQTELAEMVGIGRASIGSMIDRLEERGLVTRNPHPNDRRVWLVGITSDGTELVEKFYEIDAGFQREIRHDISREERQHLASLLERLDANVDAILTSPNTIEERGGPHA